jgi:hypothetical protein
MHGGGTATANTASKPQLPGGPESRGPGIQS